jgi:sugar phosphate isomerase/epimerase
MIKAAGFTEIELDLNRLEMPIEDFRKMLDERGLKMPSIIVDYNPVVKDPNDIARKAKILGASYIVVPLIPHKQNQFGIEDAKKAVKDFNRAGQVLSKQGLIFCYHSHGYEFRPYGKGTLFDYMVQYTDPRYVSFEMDVFWVAYPGQDPVKLLNKYGNRWKLVHLKDLRKGVKGDLSGQTAEENNVALGSGQIDFPAVLRAAQRVGVERYFIEDESPDAVAHVPQSLAYLKSLNK